MIWYITLYYNIFLNYLLLHSDFQSHFCKKFTYLLYVPYIQPIPFQIISPKYIQIKIAYIK
jgi:hypothetical protein